MVVKLAGIKTAFTKVLPLNDSASIVTTDGGILYTVSTFMGGYSFNEVNVLSKSTPSFDAR